MDVRDAANVNIRGWLEGERDDIALARAFIEENASHWYNFLWSFPHQQASGHWYAFYGGYVDVQSVDWFLDQLRRLAALTVPAATPRIRGLFVVSDEGNAMTQWQVREGQVDVESGDPRYAYLDT